ncbi:aspartate aminotransferase family protein [Stigmatella hybrida]|uniref:aspartate aminotransferase family protein n=1 Tax=Stigmatella hybrida TaxID=394097 RepID=UPI001CDA574D|nr:aspartate aminotransferase family protein [Stigmatella hybrida]
MESKTVRAKHKQYMLPSVANYYEEPVVLHEGQGSRVSDLDGKSYLDFFGGILTVSVGHANARVNAAVSAQLQRLSHVSTLYPTVPIVELAEKLVSVAPGNLQKAFFTASGTEANETAVVLAQVATGNQEILALRHGYSGRSVLAQSLTANSNYRAVPSQVAAVKHALSPYCYRCPLKLEPGTCGVACAKDLDELIRTTTTGRIAGMLAEPIQGVGGFITPPREYFEIAAEIVRKYGGLMIIDEVQTGFGRTGTMWGSQQYHVEPDLMTMAKGIANGLPLAATLCTPAIGEAFQASTISTFGGNPLSCAAAVAVLEEIEERHLVENAAKRGAELREGLERLQRQHPKTIGDVRGMGLMQAMELVVDETARDRTPNPRATLQLFEETKKRGLLIGKGGLSGNTIRLAPPLTISASEVAEGLRALEESFAAMGVG